MTQTLDIQHFANAIELRDWLNKYSDWELQRMGFVGKTRLQVKVLETWLGDDVTVLNLAVGLRMRAAQ